MSNYSENKMDKIRKKINSFLFSHVEFNYIYFGVFLIFLLLLNIHHNFLISSESLLPRVYFLIYTIGETIIEMLLLILIGQFIRRYLPKSLYYFFIACSFLFLLTHVVDFLLVRLMDMSFWSTLAKMLDETLENFIEMIYLTGIDIKLWLLFIPMLLLIPIGGVFLYLYTHKLSIKKPIKISRSHLLAALFIIPTGLICLDAICYSQIRNQESERFSMVLPWKSLLLNHPNAKIALASAFAPLRDEAKVQQKIAEISPPKAHLPNIYIFVAESLRDDYIEELYAPHLTSFKQANVSYPRSLSNANATQLSWYAIFHANYPLYWSKAKQMGWKSGSVPLQILTQMGYSTHVYSSAGLKYYGLDDLIFGQNHYLASHYHLYPHYAPKEAWQSDKEAMHHLMKDIQNPQNKEGQIFIVFLDCTHFDYDWPTDFPVNFAVQKQALGKKRLMSTGSEIDMIKNRYKNSIQYVDSLFGQVTKELFKQDLYDDSIIIFTGDHGEEFEEEGQLFHASRLSTMQTRVCLYYKMGDNRSLKETLKTQTTSSHVDIFPTILDYLGVDRSHKDLVDGYSLFDPRRPQFVLSARYNASQTPYEFALTNESHRVILRFDQPCNIFNTKELSVLKIQDSKNQIIEFDDPILQIHEIEREFEHALNCLIHRVGSF